MPNLPQATVPRKLRAPVYPARVGGGLVWVYLGPADKQPEFPNYEFMQLPADHSIAFRAIWNVNFVQGVEANLDSSHIGILHNDWAFFGERKERATPEMRDVVIWDDDRPTITVHDHPGGFYATSIRNVEKNGESFRYARVHNYILPFGTFVPAPLINLHVPIDDENTTSFGIFFDKKPVNVEFCTQNMGLDSSISETLSPRVQRYLGTRENNWFQDKSAMGRSFSGLHNPSSEDYATISSMGPITDRSKESTAGSDVAVMRMRAMLIKAARALESGEEPVQMSAEESARMVCGQGIVADDERWRELVD
jgi:hypothetical protein